MGSILRLLSSYLRLEPGEFVNLSFLYFATFVMRAAAFAGVAVMQHVLSNLPDFWRGVLFSVYPLAEIATVGYFGTLCDRIGRKRILVFAHLVTAGAVFLFIPSLGVPFVPEQRGTWDLLRAVLSNPDIRRLLPVYIPVVALYGYVISFTDKLIGVQTGPAEVGKLIVVVAAIGAPLAVSLIVGGRISDRARMRRPFMALGLACFRGLAIVISFGPTVDELYGRWPLVAVLAAGAGGVPPAALAYLGGIVQHSVTGTTFRIYSIIFGSGLIVGPILGGALTSAPRALAFAGIALGLIGVAGVGLIFIREPSKAPRAPAGLEATVPPARR